MGVFVEKLFGDKHLLADSGATFSLDNKGMPIEKGNGYVKDSSAVKNSFHTECKELFSDRSFRIP